jgi:hypothetical protein
MFMLLKHTKRAIAHKVLCGQPWQSLFSQNLLSVDAKDPNVIHCGKFCDENDDGNRSIDDVIVEKAWWRGHESDEVQDDDDGCAELSAWCILPSPVNLFPKCLEISSGRRICPVGPEGISFDPVEQEECNNCMEHIRNCPGLKSLNAWREANNDTNEYNERNIETPCGWCVQPLHANIVRQASMTSLHPAWRAYKVGNNSSRSLVVPLGPNTMLGAGAVKAVSHDISKCPKLPEPKATQLAKGLDSLRHKALFGDVSVWNARWTRGPVDLMIFASAGDHAKKAAHPLAEEVESISIWLKMLLRHDT